MSIVKNRGESHEAAQGGGQICSLTSVWPPTDVRQTCGCHLAWLTVLLHQLIYFQMLVRLRLSGWFSFFYFLSWPLGRIVMGWALSGRQDLTFFVLNSSDYITCHNKPQVKCWLFLSFQGLKCFITTVVWIWTLQYACYQEKNFAKESSYFGKKEQSMRSCNHKAKRRRERQLSFWWF